MTFRYDECPNCGNMKHHQFLRIKSKNSERRTFKCKSCGFVEYDFQEYRDYGRNRDPAVERMGNAFRDFLKEKKCLR